MSTTIENCEKIPWYRGRLFWGILTIFFIVGIPTIGLMSFNPVAIWYANSGPITSLPQMILGMSDVARILGQLLYVIITVGLLSLAFKNKKVKFFYILPLVISCIIGTAIISSFLSGL